MTKKKLTAMLMAVLMGMTLFAGGEYTAKAEDTQKETAAEGETDTEAAKKEDMENAEREVQEIAVPSCGLSFSIEKKYRDMGLEVQAYDGNPNGYPMALVYYYYKELLDERISEIFAMPEEELTEEIINEFNEEQAAHMHFMMAVTLVEKEEYDKQIADGVVLDEMTGLENTEEFAENNGYVYLISTLEQDKGEMDETETKNYKACLDYLQTIKETMTFSEVEEQTAVAAGYPAQMPAFTTKDLAGNEVTEDIFAGKDLTVLNIWGTFCTPCIEEMPELGEWENELPENVQIVGLVSDIAGDGDTERLELASKIMEKAGAGFVNLIPTAEMNELLSKVVGVPTTIFVDKTGTLVGEPIVGANVAGYKAFVEDFLSEK